MFTQFRECLFGGINGDQMMLSGYGLIAHDELLKTAQLRPTITIDKFVIMPDHIHAIITVRGGDEGTARRALTGTPEGRGMTTEGFGRPVAGSIPTIVRSYKSAVAKRINDTRKTPGEPVWHRSYYEHVIRNEAEMRTIADYIEANPSRWAEDEENVRK